MKKKEQVCEKNCPDYRGMAIEHDMHCKCSCHGYICDLAPGEHTKECTGHCTN